MIVYSMVVIPWRIGFRQDASGGMIIFDYSVDAVFCIDIVVCFNSAYFEEVREMMRTTYARVRAPKGTDGLFRLAQMIDLRGCRPSPVSRVHPFVEGTPLSQRPQAPEHEPDRGSKPGHHTKCCTEIMLLFVSRTLWCTSGLRSRGGTCPRGLCRTSWAPCRSRRSCGLCFPPSVPTGCRALSFSGALLLSLLQLARVFVCCLLLVVLKEAIPCLFS